jgi:hypothetical protein
MKIPKKRAADHRDQKTKGDSISRASLRYQRIFPESFFLGKRWEISKIEALEELSREPYE